MKISTTVDAIRDIIPFDEALKKIKNHGYDAIDYDCAKSTYDSDGGIYTLTDKDFISYFKNEKKIIDNFNLEVCQLHAPFPPATFGQSKDEYNHRIESIRRTLIAAEILESPYLVTHAAMRCDWDQPDDNPPLTKQINMDMFDRLIPTAEKAGVKLALENVPHGVATSTPDDIIDYIDTVNSDYLVACLDTGHSNMTSIKPPEFARRLGCRLKVLHVHDNRLNDDSHMTPFCGNIDWKDFSNALKDVNYDGTFSFESDVMVWRFPIEFYDDILALEYKIGKYITLL